MWFKKQLANISGRQWRHWGKNVGIMIIFAACFSFVMRFMLVPSGLYVGGLTGFTQAIIYTVISPNNPDARSTYFFVAYIVLNIPFFIFGWLKIGKIFTINSFIFLAAENLWNLLWTSPLFSNFIILKDLLGTMATHTGIGYYLGIYVYAVFGGILAALCLAPIYHNNACHGGSNFYATYLAIKKRKSIGKFQRIFSVFVIFFGVILNYLVNHDPKIADQNFFNLFFNYPIFVASLVCAFTMTFMFNLMYRDLKIVYVQVISHKVDEIINHLNKMDEITHYLKSTTVHDIRKKRDKDSFFTIVTYREYKMIKNVIIKHEPKALIYAMNVTDFRGKVKYSYIR